MITEKIYYTDAYIKEFKARVLSSVKADEGYDTVLDRTAFFPEEGGQYSDTGEISGALVSYVFERDGVIHHITSEQLAEGCEVFGKINFDERYEKMQCHTAEHILSGLFHSLYGLDNVGFHLGADDVTMDISAPISRDDIYRVESLANEIIYKNVEVKTSFPSSDELSSLVYRAKLDLAENVRIVDIGEYDSCACCAPHVAMTGEIGIIKIFDFEKLRGGMRLHISAGRRAYARLCESYTELRKICALLSAMPNEGAALVEKLICDLKRREDEYQAYRNSHIDKDAAALGSTDGNLVLFLDGASVPEMIRFSNAAVPKVGGVLVLLSGEEGSYKYVISSVSVDLRERSREINEALSGRGGGRAEMIQGGFSATMEEIKRYFA